MRRLEGRRRAIAEGLKLLQAQLVAKASKEEVETAITRRATRRSTRRNGFVLTIGIEDFADGDDGWRDLRCYWPWRHLLMDGGGDAATSCAETASAADRGRRPSLAAAPLRPLAATDADITHCEPTSARLPVPPPRGARQGGGAPHRRGVERLRVGRICALRPKWGYEPDDDGNSARHVRMA